jgi:hypothetical protein
LLKVNAHCFLRLKSSASGRKSEQRIIHDSEHQRSTQFNSKFCEMLR